MDAVFALILPLVGGFFVIREATFIKYQAAREDGHRLYFRIAWYGFWLFLASFLILGSLRAISSLAGIPLYGDVEHTVLAGLAPFMKEGQQSAARVGFVTVCAFAMILGRFSPPVINRFTKKSSVQALMEATSQNERMNWRNCLLTPWRWQSEIYERFNKSKVEGAAAAT